MFIYDNFLIWYNTQYFVEILIKNYIKKLN